MVGRSDIDHVRELIAEYNEIVLALEVIDDNGTITAVTLTTPGVEAGTMDQPPRSETVSTQGLVYPPQMITAIKLQLETRRDAINGELAALGVTA